MTKKRFIKLYQGSGLIATIIFISVGLLFLLLPEQIYILFNILSRYFNLTPTPLEGHSFYLVLTAGYMYLVAVLAFFMYRYPDKYYFALLLTHGKLASAVISLYMFIIHEPYLIYISNFLVDGLIGIIALILYYKRKELDI